MGNSFSRDERYQIPPGFMPTVHPYPPFATSTSWNPFKRNKMRKREKALREYLYTTPMIFQYPGAFTVTQPGQNIVQPGIPQVHTAIPIAPMGANGMATQIPVSTAPMVVAGAGAAPAPGAGGAAAPVIPSQMMPMTFPGAFDYSAMLDRGATAPVIPRRSRRSERRSRRRSPTSSAGSSGSETDSRYSSPGSYDSADYDGHHRSSSGNNPLPRPPKDVLSSTPFRSILTQLPSAQYNSWGIGGTSSYVPESQSQPQPTTYSNVRPRRQRRRRQRDQFSMPSLPAAVNALTRPFVTHGMSMPEPQPAPPPPQAGPSMTPRAPPAFPHSPQMHMPSPDMGPQGPPVIPQGMMPMPSPAPAGSTPFVGRGLSTPRTPHASAMPPHGQTMPAGAGFAPSPSSGHVPMAMPSPAMGHGTRPQTPMIPPPGSMLQPTVGMAMPSPSLGQGAGAGPVQGVLKFNGYGEHSGLLYHSPHTVLYQEELYPTALHLFEARKFLDHRPDLAESIRQCERVDQVTAISAELAEYTRRDWGTVALSTMDEVLYLKFRQHGDLRTLLLNTYPLELVYVESGDQFWGDGAGTGMNELGNSLMRVRELLRREANM